MASVIHATARAMERLRWPKGARKIQYIFPVAKLACGADYDPRQTNGGLNLFRAEDATALLNNAKMSTIQRPPVFGEGLMNSILGRHHVEPGTRKRKWKLPTCTECSIECDWALEHPYLIHVTNSAFEDLKSRLGRRFTPQEILDAQKKTRVGFCGEPILSNTPIFTGVELRRAETYGQIDWLPTCEVCHAKVIEWFGFFSKDATAFAALVHGSKT